MKSNFQIIIIVVFLLAAIVGVLVFSGAIPIGDSNSSLGVGTVTLWGTAKSAAINPLLEVFNANNPTYSVTYVEKNSATFDQELLEALAEGAGPDLFFLPDNLAFHYANKIFTIPFSSYPISSFNQNFSGAGDVFLTSQGILAFPMAVDPLVMYYNRSMLDAKTIVFPPADWDEFMSLVEILTEKDESGRIKKSGVALGQFSNVSNAKEIISTLFMQSGNSIISEEGSMYISTLDKTSPNYDLGSVLKFYADFTNPLKTAYSWNKSFPSSRDFFSTNNLAFYFGFASELPYLVNRNPNQDFMVAPMPQIKNGPFYLTGARTTGLAISAFSRNFNTAFIAATEMATGSFASSFANALGIAPARRDLLATPQNDAYSPIFYGSALYGRSWLDPSPRDTDNIFRGMVENVLSNSMTPTNAVKDASAKLSLLLLR
jgi:ABC-type glycerol-3-phosphate transport system substrate-binding protein